MYNALIVAKYYVVLSNLNIVSTGLLNWGKPHSVFSLIMYNRYIDFIFCFLPRIRRRLLVDFWISRSRRFLLNTMLNLNRNLTGSMDLMIPNIDDISKKIPHFLNIICI